MTSSGILFDHFDLFKYNQDISGSRESKLFYSLILWKLMHIYWCMKSIQKIFTFQLGIEYFDILCLKMIFRIEWHIIQIEQLGLLGRSSFFKLSHYKSLWFVWGLSFKFILYVLPATRDIVVSHFKKESGPIRQVMSADQSSLFIVSNIPSLSAGEPGRALRPPLSIIVSALVIRWYTYSEFAIDSLPLENC